MELPHEYTEAEMIKKMIIESENELTQCKVLERLMNRAIIKGSNVKSNQEYLGNAQKKMGILKETIQNLNDALLTIDKG